jgi:multidrug efflux system membrane fusion protein
MEPHAARRIIALVAVLATVGCRHPPPTAPPAPQVTVSRPIHRDVTEHREYPGRIDAVESVDIRARVQGFLQKIHYQEGTEVKKDTLLYEIDPQPFQASLDAVQADVRRLEATLKQAESEAARATRLHGTGAISEEDYIARTSARDEARANLAKAKATVESARIQLSYTKIYAPIDGRIGRTLVTEGNLVGFNEPTLLTTLVRMDPIYIYFEAPEGDYLEYRRLMQVEGLPTAEQAKTPLDVGLVTDTGYPYHGTLNFRDNRIDPGTGTVMLRGTLSNPERILVPGLYARVRVPFGKPRERLLVPEAALSADQRGRFLLVVKPDHAVEYRPVTSGVTVDGLTVIEKGLNPDDLVIVNGLQKARPGAQVEPQQQE